MTAWYMLDGELIEGKGIAPDAEIKPSLDDLLAGEDVQMKGAIRAVLALN